MPYLKKVNIKGNDYFYLFHTVRDGDKFRKLSKYIGKVEPSREELKKLKEEFTRKIEGNVLTKMGEERKPKVNVLGALREMQEKNGCLPENKINALSKEIGMPVVEIYDMASFYSIFSFDKKGKKVVRICNSPSCYLNGSLNVLDEAKRLLGIKVGETTKNGKFSLELTSCIGCCDKAPAIMVNDELITNLTKEKLKKLLK